MEQLLKQATGLTSHSPSSAVTAAGLINEGVMFHVPRDYQLYGVNWLLNVFKTPAQCGCILGDEMGLGKTFQTVAFLRHLISSQSTDGPFLILSPLSVIDNWVSEVNRCAPSLMLQVYIGGKEKREEIRAAIASKILSGNWKNARCHFHILLTSYELCLKDADFLQRFKWATIVIDEAHRMKNSASLLYQELLNFDIGFKVLLTGTPVQNNLEEVYSLLSFINPRMFKPDLVDEFKKYFQSVQSGNSPGRTKELHGLLKPFLLRRVKSEVVKDLPKKSEVLLYSGLSALQKKTYKGILAKELATYSADGVLKKTRLVNILMQLRKCCNHPYIFPGIEEEPFQIGEHLVEASGKLLLLDKLLQYLHASGHKVLLFSQMTIMLDIVQDYMGYRGYAYERLDGSVRGEERFLAVNNFNANDETFVFLLSTKAGGQGLNLVSADTVIFLDHDFNPQNDLQAAARAHRIGQKRHVKVIRLVTRNTVEEIILKRADAKLKLTHAVVEGGQFSNIQQQLPEDPAELSDILKFGLDDLLKSDDSSVEDIDFKSILGQSVNGIWADAQDELVNEDDSVEDHAVVENMYVYEGKDYSKESASDLDKTKFDELVAGVIAKQKEGERSLRKDKATVVLLAPLEGESKRKRRALTDEEKEVLRQKRAESKAKKLKMEEEKKRERLLKLWEKNQYSSMKIEFDSESESSLSDEDDVGDDNEKEKCRQIKYVVGDVTCPTKTLRRDAIIVHCVDDSGSWGRGGVFTAIDKRSRGVKAQYELAAAMKDLSLGDVHLIALDPECEQEETYVGLLVAHTRDRHKQLSGLLMNHLQDGLEKLRHLCSKTGASVHFPRIGYNTPNFNWYGTEKLIKKELAQHKIPTYVYYFPRRSRLKVSQSSAHAASEPEPSCSRDEQALSPTPSSTSSFSVDQEQSIDSWCSDEK